MRFSVQSTQPVTGPEQKIYNRAVVSTGDGCLRRRHGGASDELGFGVSRSAS